MLFLPILLACCFLLPCQPLAVPPSPDPPSALNVWHWRESARELASHAFSSYMAYGYPSDEVRPLSCQPRSSHQRERGTLDDVLGGYSLTLIDSLDTLALLGDLPAFRCAVSRVVNSVSFDTDVNVSVFEASIRVVGGLLSAHLLSVDPQLGIWLGAAPACTRALPAAAPAAALATLCQPAAAAPRDACLPAYGGQLLAMAAELARRLLPAFDTPTGMPYHRINLRSGAPDPASRETCTAAAGTYLLEFALLSRLTGDSAFEAVARRANAALWARRSAVGLVGSAIDALDGHWRTSHSGIGGGIDSWLEYLPKAAIALGDERLQAMADEALAAVAAHTEYGGVHLEVASGQGWRAPRLPATLSSLQSFFPGLEVLTGALQAARAHLLPLATLWGKYRALPEVYRVDTGGPPPGLGYGADAPLRPELAESAYHLFTATRDASLLRLAAAQVAAISNASRAACGFASLADVATGRLDDRMDSYFLAETVKYLFLTLDSALWHWHDGAPLGGGRRGGGGAGGGRRLTGQQQRSSPRPTPHSPLMFGSTITSAPTPSTPTPTPWPFSGWRRWQSSQLALAMAQALALALAWPLPWPRRQQCCSTQRCWLALWPPCL